MKCREHTEFKECIENFYFFECDKNDNTILNFPTKSLENTITCEFLLLKILIIRLRRSNQKEDWALYKDLLEKNIDTILNDKTLISKKHKGFRLRWIVSLLETYVDHGNEIESRNALIACLFHKYEKMYATVLDNHILMKKNYDFNFHKEISGLKIKDKPDLMQNLFRRIDISLKETPIILKIFKEIIHRISSEQDSILNFFMSNNNTKECREDILFFLKNER